MTWIDLLIFGVIALSALISLIRGFVKESISLVTWVVAGVIAFRYFTAVSDLLEPFIESSMVRGMTGGGILFVLTLIVGAIINFIVGKMVSSTGLSGTDKALGIIFGGARGVLIVSMVVLLFSLTPAPSSDVWQGTASIGFFEQIAEWIKSVVPSDAADAFKIQL